MDVRLTSLILSLALMLAASVTTDASDDRPSSEPLSSTRLGRVFGSARHAVRLLTHRPRGSRWHSWRS